MTEAEWLACTDPQAMLELLRGKVSDRKLRLFAVASCRHVWHLVTDVRWRAAVETVEGYADGVVTPADFSQARELAGAAFWEAEVAFISGTTESVCQIRAEEGESVSVESMIAAVVVPVAVESAFATTNAGWGSNWYSVHDAFLRDIIGNPFRAVSVDSAWLTPTVLSLAQAIYDGRAYDRLPIFADALEEAGCTDADILAHWRQPGVHVKGCWALDLVMGKELSP